MTETTEQKVKIKVTKHPREMFYEGRSTRDHMVAQVDYLNTSPKGLCSVKSNTSEASASNNSLSAFLSISTIL